LKPSEPSSKINLSRQLHPSNSGGFSRWL
jgi:hypothetical protein